MKVIATSKGDSSVGIGPDQIVIELSGNVTDLNSREQRALLQDAARFASRWLDPLDHVLFERQCAVCEGIEGQHDKKCPEAM